MRRVMRWSGMGALALVALALLTVVPWRSESIQTMPVDVRAASSAPGAPECATMALTGSLESTLRSPIFDWWGFSSVSVTLVAPRVAVGGETPCPEDTDVASSVVVVYTPACSSPARVDDPDETYAFLPEAQSRCGGHGVMLPVLVLDHGVDSHVASFGDQRISLGSSGIAAAASWCLQTDFAIAYSELQGEEVVIETVAGDVLTGEACVPLS
jgi:hypothetical protein